MAIQVGQHIIHFLCHQKFFVAYCAMRSRYFLCSLRVAFLVAKSGTNTLAKFCEPNKRFELFVVNLCYCIFYFFSKIGNWLLFPLFKWSTAITLSTGIELDFFSLIIKFFLRSRLFTESIFLSKSSLKVPQTNTLSRKITTLLIFLCVDLDLNLEG